LAWMRVPGGGWFILSPLLAVPLGIASLVLSAKQLAGIRAHTIDPAGRTQALVGRIVGTVGTVGWTVFGAWLLYMMAHMFDGKYTETIEGPPGVRQATTHQGGLVVDEWREVRKPDGSWVKEGPAVFRVPFGVGKKVAEGSFRDDKRDGSWTFWNPDGS